MVSTSKILTVSYGTFSCTLEGFDDSFDTMKAIAEYFRDLSAGDRYFGAEPATPDAEMLARIAEREISRHVEARDADGKIHLRAGPSRLSAVADLSQDTRSQPPASSDTTAPDVDPAEMSQTREPVDFSTVPPADKATEEHTQEYRERPEPRGVQISSESIADKLRRIRAVAGPSGSAFSKCGYDEEDQFEDFASEPAEPVITEESTDKGFAADSEIASDAEGIKAPADDTRSVIGSVTGPDSDAQPEPQTNEIAGPDVSVLASTAMDAPETLQSGSDAIPAPNPETTDASTVSDDDILTRLSADDRSDDASALSTEPADNVILADCDSLDKEDTDAYHDLENLPGDTSDEEDDYLAATEDSPSGSTEDTLAQLLADTLQSGQITQEESDAIDQSEQTHSTLSELADASTDSDEKQTSAADPRPLAARVFKIKRADLEAALTRGEIEEEMSATDTGRALDPEAEAELQRELADVEAELDQTSAPDPLTFQGSDASALRASDTDNLAAQDHDDSEEDDGETSDEIQATTSEAEHEAADTRDDRHRTQSALDAQASRIFDQADTQLDEPESNERRSAIQHLRAAVAATKAERRAGGAMSPGVDDQPYRKDLQNAVRPRRPQAAPAATPRPSAMAPGRPAPLKLVAEQRIDTPVAPVRPRRITRADLVTAPVRQTPASPAVISAKTAHHADVASGFAGYAERMGANSLTDLLEAAAAYMADVEGTPQFSRPMLMQKLREAHDEGFSREEGLRSFGQLLRQGKLQKLKGGRFAVTEDTDFRQSA